MRSLALILFSLGAAQAWQPDKVATGQPAPDFSAPRHGGGTFQLSELQGKNVVLVFYRGHW